MEHKIKLRYQLPPSYHLGSKGNACFMEPPHHPRYEIQSIFTQNGNSPPWSQPQYYYKGNGYWEIEQVDKYFKPLPYTNDLVKLWEEDWYAYAKTCYSPDGKDRNVSNAKCSVKPGDMPADKHLAYLAVKKYYPEAKPRIDFINNPPSWGKDRSSVYRKTDEDWGETPGESQGLKRSKKHKTKERAKGMPTVVRGIR